MHMIDKLVWKSFCSSMIVYLGEIPGNGIVRSQVVPPCWWVVSRVTSSSQFAQSFPGLALKVLCPGAKWNSGSSYVSEHFCSTSVILHSGGKCTTNSRLLNLSGDLCLFSFPHQDTIFVSGNLQSIHWSFLYTNSKQVIVLMRRSCSGLTEQSQFAPFVWIHK